MIPRIKDAIIWTSVLDSPAELKEGIVTKVSKTLCWVDNYHKLEDCINTDFIWPAHVKEELINILTQRAKLKKAYNDSIGLIFELNNEIARGES